MHCCCSVAEQLHKQEATPLMSVNTTHAPSQTPRTLLAPFKPFPVKSLGPVSAKSIPPQRSASQSRRLSQSLSPLLHSTIATQLFEALPQPMFIPHSRASPLIQSTTVLQPLRILQVGDPSTQNVPSFVAASLFPAQFPLFSPPPPYTPSSLFHPTPSVLGSRQCPPCTHRRMLTFVVFPCVCICSHSRGPLSHFKDSCVSTTQCASTTVTLCNVQSLSLAAPSLPLAQIS